MTDAGTTDTRAFLRDAGRPDLAGTVAELVIVIDGVQHEVIPLDAALVDFWLMKLATSKCLAHREARAKAKMGEEGDW